MGERTFGTYVVRTTIQDDDWRKLDDAALESMFYALETIIEQTKERIEQEIRPLLVTISDGQ
jgi:hypothetical protein